MLTPSLVFAYWICGSMAQPFYDMAGMPRASPNHAPSTTAMSPAYLNGGL